jgi:hypothetical protein
LIQCVVVHHNYERDLTGIKQDPCGKRLTFCLNYGTVFFKTDLHTSQRTHPVPVVTSSGLMLVREII